MDRTAIFVDAGYLCAAGGNLTVGTGRRSQLSVAVKPLAVSLMRLVKEDSHLPVLRTYWYDACRDGKTPTPEQELIKDIDFLKLRLGRLNSKGEQKGVDSLIFRDLLTLSRERALCTAYLVAGDADMVEAVSLAQDLGVQLFLVSVIPAGNSGVSRDLIDVVDREIALEKDQLKPYFSRRTSIPTLAAEAA